jgi:hypothetical protein
MSLPNLPSEKDYEKIVVRKDQKTPSKFPGDKNVHFMAFQNLLFQLVEKPFLKTEIRSVVRVSRIWIGIPDVVYLAGNFGLQTQKILVY